MKFYKVVSKDYENIIGLCENALWTEREIKNLKKDPPFKYYVERYFDRIFETVEISKQKTYWFFGIRKELKD